MARLPIPGSDDGKWGQILNEYLSQSLDYTGTLKPNTVGTSQLQDNAVVASKLAAGAVTKVDVGLENVDNTSDISKPVSAATQAALNTKLNTADLDTQTATNIANGGSATGAALSTSNAAGLRPTIEAALRRAQAQEPPLMASPPTVTVYAAGSSGLAASQYDRTMAEWTGQATTSGKVGSIPIATNHDTWPGQATADVLVLGGGQATKVNHLPYTVDAAFNVAHPTFRTRYHLAGTKLAVQVVPYGTGSTYGGACRFKIDGKYVSLDWIPFEGTSSRWVVLDGVPSGEHILDIEGTIVALGGFQAYRGDRFSAPAFSGPSVYVMADSFGTAAGTYPFGGLAWEIPRLLGFEDWILDSYGGSGFAVNSGHSSTDGSGGTAGTNYVDRAAAHLPTVGSIDLHVVIGSVNDKDRAKVSLSAVQDAAAAYYALVAPAPVYQVVYNSSSDDTMDAVLGAYQAAADAATNEVHIIDLTDELTGSGSAGIDAPRQRAITTAAGSGPAAGTYSYAWTAVDFSGNETTPSAFKTVTLDGSTAPTVSISAQVPYAASYNVYRITGQNPGASVKVASAITAQKWTDTGVAGTTASPPTSNTTQPAGSTGTSALWRGRDGTHRSVEGHRAGGLHAAVGIALALGNLPGDI